MKFHTPQEKEAKRTSSVATKIDTNTHQLASLTPPTFQLVEEEEELQMKAINNKPFQLMEEEEELQMKSKTNTPAQLQTSENKTGMPDDLKSGIENLSGYDMSDVKVHYNSSEPAQLNAHAYAQGTDIHVASGQEQHLAHEAWHVVQQKQGRVQPTTQVGGQNVNDNVGLETEADVMGAKALQKKSKKYS